MIGIERLLHIAFEEFRAGSVVEIPNIDGVEPEVRLAGGAESDCLLAILVLVALAVVPQTDCVEVLQVGVLGRALERLQQVVVDVDVV